MKKRFRLWCDVVFVCGKVVESCLELIGVAERFV